VSAGRVDGAESLSNAGRRACWASSTRSCRRHDVGLPARARRRGLERRRLGILTALTYETPQGLERAIAATRAPHRPPVRGHPDLPADPVPRTTAALIDVMVARGSRSSRRLAAQPLSLLERLKAGNALVIINAAPRRYGAQGAGDRLRHGEHRRLRVCRPSRQRTTSRRWC